MIAFIVAVGVAIGGLALSAGIAGLTIRQAWRRQVWPGSLWLALCSTLTAVYNLASLLGGLTSELTLKILYFQIRSTLLIWIIPLALLFTLSALGQARRLKWWQGAVLWVGPMLYGVLLWTNDWHHGIWTEASLQPLGNGLMRLEISNGFLLTLSNIYGISVLLLALLGVMVAFIALPARQRQSLILIVVGTLLPFGSLIASVSGLNALQPFSLTPPVMAVSCFVWWLSIHRYRLFGLFPVARDALVEFLTEAVLVTDNDQNLVDLNHAAQRLFSLTPTAFGQPAAQALAAYPEVVTLLSRPVSARLELTDHGTRHQYEAQTQPIRLNRTEQIGWLTILRDASDKEQLSQALSLSEQRYQRISQLMSDWMFSAEYEADGTRHPEWNMGDVYRLTGYTWAEVLNQQWESIIHPEDLQRYLISQFELRRTGRAATIDYRIYHCDGSVRWLRDYTSAELDAQGRVRRLYGAVQDITEQKQAEVALRDIESRYLGIFNNTAEAVFWLRVRADGELVFDGLNPVMEAASGLASATTFDRPLTEQLSGSMAAYLIAQCQVCLQTGQPHQFIDPLGGASTRQIWQTLLIPMRSAQGVQRLVGIARNITEQERERRMQIALYEIARAAATADNLEALFTSIHANLETLMPARNLYIALYDDQTGLLSFPYFVDERDEPPGAPAPLGHGLTEYVLRTCQPQLVTPERFDELQIAGEVRRVGVRSIDWLGVPLVVQGQAIGVLTVQSYTPGLRYGEAEKDILTFVANQIALVVNHKRAEEARQERAHYLTRLNEITNAALQTANVQETLETLNNRMGELFNADSCTLLVWDPMRQQLRPRAAWGHRALEFLALPPFTLISLPIDERTLWHGSPVILPAGTLIPEHTTELHFTLWMSYMLRERAVLLLPLVADDERQGLLVLTRVQPEAFTLDDIARGQQAAGQVALAMAKAQALAIAQRRVREAETLRQAGAVVAAILQPAEAAQRILEQLANVVPYATASVQLLRSREGVAELEVVGGRGWAQEEPVLGVRLRVSEARFNAQVIETKQPIIITDVYATPGLLPFFTEHIRGWLGVPLLVKDTVIGLITLDSPQPDFFTVEHARLASAFADQVAVAIENARLFDALQRQTEELATLYQASSQLLDVGGSLLKAAQSIAQVVTRDFEVPHCAVFVLDQSLAALRYLAQSGPRPVAYVELWSLHRPSLLTQAAQDGNAYYQSATAEASLRPYANLALPLKAQGQVIGALNLESEQADIFSEAHIRVLTNFAEHAGLALANAQLIQQLDDARQTAQEASELKSMFLANTSHELRTPLTGILGSLNLVLSGLCDTPEEEREFVGLAYQSGQRLMDLINSLLDLSKIESGRYELHLQAVDLAPILLEAQALFQPQALEKSLALEVHIPSDAHWRVYADLSKLRQIVLNLIGNAVKFTETGAITVTTTVSPVAQHVRIIVQDTGIGIPLEQQARLFQPFVQADGSTTRKYGGTGLGLSISRRLAEMMDGSLTLYSAGKNQGSTFTLTLPLADVEQPAGLSMESQTTPAKGGV